jgi:16S rRNA (cytidine1402-2'-O)-methyltransferase
LVATPIGNLEDITARGLRILGQARLIAAEDTRLTQKLLTHYHIHTRQISYFEHNKLSRLEQILGELSAGDVALVSDAGTPGLNDPGYDLVRAALLAGHQVSAVPGPSAPVAALVASGLPTASFLYLGYLPRKTAERRASLERVADAPHTLVFLEAPHRLRATLADMQTVLGDRPAAVARELTKLHEEIWRGDLSAAGRHFDHPRGEFVLVIAGRQESAPKRWTQARVRAAVSKRLAGGQPPTAAAAELAAESGWTRRDIYKLASGRG